MSTTTVADIMTSDPIYLARTDSIARAREEMEMSSIRHLPVVDDGALVGMITQRDLLRYKGSPDDLVGDVMKTDLVTVSPETAAHEAAYLILRDSIGSVPVTDEGDRLVGIVTDTDFVYVAYRSLGGRVSLDERAAEERESDNL